MSNVAIERSVGGNRARMALGTGVLSAALFFGVAFVFEGIWWLVAPVVGVVALALAISALRSREPGRGMAIAGAVLAGIVVAWFVGYMVVEAVS